MGGEGRFTRDGDAGGCSVPCRYHAVGEDGARRGRQAGEQAHGMAAVQDQRLLLAHLAQVVHRQAELHPHNGTYSQFRACEGTQERTCAQLLKTWPFPP